MSLATLIDLTARPGAMGSRPGTASSGPRGAEALPSFLEFVPPGHEEAKGAAAVLEALFKAFAKLLTLLDSPAFHASRQARQLGNRIVDIVRPILDRVQNLSSLLGPPPRRLAFILAQLGIYLVELHEILVTMPASSAVRLVLPWPSATLRRLEEQIERIRALDSVLERELRDLQSTHSRET